MYPTPAVSALIKEQFVPVRIHIKQQPAAWKRFGIRWTPTIIVLASDGHEVRREEGFIPADEMLGWLLATLGHAASNAKDWKTAEHWFGEASRLSNTEAGPEGLYWQGVSRYSATHDHDILPELNRSIAARYPNTIWAKRASIWT